MRTVAAGSILVLMSAATISRAEENPWPRIRKERIEKLLPAAMERAGVDAWIVVCRENDNDPLAAHVGGENAGGIGRVPVLPEGRRRLLGRDLACGRGDGVEGHRPPRTGRRARARSDASGTPSAKEVRAAAPKKIAINSGGDSVSDGLSWTQRNALEKALGPGMDAAARVRPRTWSSSGCP